MKRNKNTLRLSEKEFNSLIKESVKHAINEITSDDIKNYIYGGIGGLGIAAAGVGTAVQSPKQSDYWPEEEDIRLVRDDDPVDFETDAPEDPEDAWNLDYVSESRIRRILRDELSKVL